jgi:ADP-ribosylglycohydrolase
MFACMAQPSDSVVSAIINLIHGLLPKIKGPGFGRIEITFPGKWENAREWTHTHTHPTGYLAAGSLAAMICFHVQGKDISDAIEEMTSILKKYPRHQETLGKVDQAIKLSCSEMKPLDAIESLGQGWIAEEALGIGLYAALKGKNYSDVIQIAANHSGDSDSTASIAGQIYGAWKGIDEIPQEWMEAPDVHDVLAQLGY